MNASHEGRLTCCLTFDVDGLAGGFGGPAATAGVRPDLHKLSKYEFGMAVGLPRLLRLLRAYELQVTFFTTGDAVQTYPGIFEEMQADGHEVCPHGWAHEPPNSLTRDEERRILERTTAAIEKVTGQRPQGYRAPAFQPSTNTINLLLESGFKYDSSLMAGDFEPYYLRDGDRWSEDGSAKFGPISDLVEIPVHWVMDDNVYFERSPGASNVPTRPDEVERIWKGELDFALKRIPGGVYTLTMHPHVICRGQRLLVLENLIESFAAVQGTVVTTVGKAVDTWVAANRRHQWSRSHPLYLRPQDTTCGRPA